MKEKQESELIGVRVPRNIKERIDKETGNDKDFRTPSEFVLQAIRFYLDYLTNQRIEFVKAESMTLDNKLNFIISELSKRES
ncbi:MAG: hypothetical protein FWD92_02795 [Methanomassiliicoccaceae archaeon]|nr:hypothetical protein [Methanomassiliicoccaceae archaeon]